MSLRDLVIASVSICVHTVKCILCNRGTTAGLHLNLLLRLEIPVGSVVMP